MLKMQIKLGLGSPTPSSELYMYNMYIIHDTSNRVRFRILKLKNADQIRVRVPDSEFRVNYVDVQCCQGNTLYRVRFRILKMQIKLRLGSPTPSQGYICRCAMLSG